MNYLRCLQEEEQRQVTPEEVGRMYDTEHTQGIVEIMTGQKLDDAQTINLHTLMVEMAVGVRGIVRSNDESED